MIKLILSLMICAAFTLQVFAQIPPEVMTPYKEYRIALEKGDEKGASKFAYEAWQAAEDSMEDHKTTGDLAINFARLTPRSHSPKNHKVRIKAYDRAIELAHLAKDSPEERELERRISKIEGELSYLKASFGRDYQDINIAFKEMDNALEQYNYGGTTFDADTRVLLTKHLNYLGQYEVAVQAGTSARLIYERSTDGIISPFLHQLSFELGRSYDLSGKPKLAALEFQKVFQRTPQTPEYEELAEKAKEYWILQYLELEELGRLQEANSAGLCDCLPKVAAGNNAIPIFRIPPSFPPRTERSGEVLIMFDLNLDGSPENVRILGHTDKKFADVTVKAANKWKYNRSLLPDNSEQRQDIPVRLKFTLRNGRGDILDAKKMNYFENAPVDAHKLALSDILEIQGARLRRR